MTNQLECLFRAGFCKYFVGGKQPCEVFPPDGGFHVANRGSKICAYWCFLGQFVAVTMAGNVIENPSMPDSMLYPWNWAEDARKADFGSPASSCSSPDLASTRLELKRGRPRADAITNLMKEGTTSPSSIKCRYCNRVFPREKSLQAHLRTHTGT